MDNLLEQLEQWNKNDEFSRCIEAIEAIPEKERGYKLTVLLGRAYSNLAVLGDHKAHGDDDEVDKELIHTPLTFWKLYGNREKMTRTGTLAWDMLTSWQMIRRLLLLNMESGGWN